jgi:hypothetical protein
VVLDLDRDGILVADLLLVRVQPVHLGAHENLAGSGCPKQVTDHLLVFMCKGYG